MHYSPGVLVDYLAVLCNGTVCFVDSDADALKLRRVQKMICWQTTVSEESHG